MKSSGSDFNNSSPPDPRASAADDKGIVGFPIDSACQKRIIAFAFEGTFSEEIMPTYRAPGNQDCAIECDGKGGAIFIEPSSCRVWCDGDSDALVKIFSKAIDSDGLDFKSSGQMGFVAGQAKLFTEWLNEFDLPPAARVARDRLSSSLASLADIGTIFLAVWRKQRLDGMLDAIRVAVPQET